MKVLTYVLSLLLGGFVYFLFATYMSASAGLNSIGPLVSFYCAILIFGLFSWLHFYYSKAGSLLLIAAAVLLYVSWPLMFLFELFSENSYTLGLVEFGIPLILTVLIIFFARKGKEEKLNRYVKLFLAIPPCLLALYAGGYFTLAFFTG